MSAVTPDEVLKQVADAVPSECLEKIVVIGSLAAGYALRAHSAGFHVRTKDIDCVLSPREDAAAAGKSIAEKLISAGWRHRSEGEFAQAGHSQTSDDKLPAVRLCPPNTDDWFIELLAEPSETAGSGKTWMRIVVNGAHYGLPSFEYLSLATFDPERTHHGVYCARPEMMALALLLEHPRISSQTMSGLIADRTMKRSNKDLGRVLAIAFLALESDENVLLEWPQTWTRALRDRFAGNWKQLCKRVGDGLRELLASPLDLDEAWHTCSAGLLASYQVTQEQLRIAGERLINDVITHVESDATSD